MTGNSPSRTKKEPGVATDATPRIQQTESVMNNNYCFLHLEDNANDAELIYEKLREQWPDCLVEQVATRDGYRAALEQNRCDLILADYSLPGFGGMEALAIAREHSPDLPFIFVSGTIGEEIAIETLKNGATDYVLKHRLSRLIPAVCRALHERDELKGKQQAELAMKKMQTQLIQQEKMASIGQLAAGIAHEINNPVCFISSNLSTLEKYQRRISEYIDFLETTLLDCCGNRYDDQRQNMKMGHILEDTQSLIAESLEGTDRVRNIVADLKSFSHTDDRKTGLFQLNDCIRTTLNIVKHEFKYVADLVLDLDNDLPNLNGNHQQIGQVIANLVVNAAHAIDGHGVITVRTRQDGDQISLCIQDTGKGIAPEHIGRIFEPFFTTKEIGKGTGLGLSICYDIITKHGGTIMVTSDAGVGTTFFIQLPLPPAEAADNGQAQL